MNPFHIPELAKQYMEYDMIQSHTELPNFPVSRTRLLYAFLQAHHPRHSDVELYSLVTSLVQMGIDTHELVSVNNEAKEKKAVRSRQLKVLAGDYFSTRFYHLLSQAGQVDMVRQLSAAICEVNRLKLTLYMRIKQLKLTAEEYIQHTVNIRSQLFLHFNRLMKGAHQGLWPEILSGISCCEVLAGEILRSDNPKEFRWSWGYWHILQNGTREEKRQLETSDQEEWKLQPMLLKYNVRNQLYAMLEEQVHLVFEKAKQLESEKLVQELIQIGEPFLRMVRTPKVLEER